MVAATLAYVKNIQTGNTEMPASEKNSSVQDPKTYMNLKFSIKTSVPTSVKIKAYENETAQKKIFMTETPVFDISSTISVNLPPRAKRVEAFINDHFIVWKAPFSGEKGIELKDDQAPYYQEINHPTQQIIYV